MMRHWPVDPKENTMTTLEAIKEDVVAELPAPNATERCDRCGAQAYIRVMSDKTQRLLFCAHHGKEHTPALVKAGFDVIDYSEALQTRYDTDEDW